MWHYLHIIQFPLSLSSLPHYQAEFKYMEKCLFGFGHSWKLLNLSYSHIFINTVKIQTKLPKCLFVFFFRKTNNGLRGELNYVRAWWNNFHAETIKFQDLSWNFSFQVVLVRLISYPDLTLSLEMWDLVKFDFEHAQCQRGPNYGLFFQCACSYSLLWFWLILRNKHGFREYSWRDSFV